MKTNTPPVKLTSEMRLFANELNECQKRHYVAMLANMFGSIRKVSEFMRISKNTVRKGLFELETGYKPEGGRVRRKGGGRKSLLDAHPEWIEAFKQVVKPYTAGLPQDEEVVWISLSVPQIVKEMYKAGHEVSMYIVRQLLKRLGYHRRSFLKELPMKECADRDAQFRIIEDVRRKVAEIGLPIISIDTKKKEMLGNFRRNGTAYSLGKPRAFDHDFPTFAEGQIIPHGIYDVSKNIGYLTIGTTHDTSEFVCDNIERVWNKHMKSQYPDANTIVILCDGGGSNSSSHHIVKEDFMRLSNRIQMKLLIMHYPPYCSKFNPIEHRMFSQITHSWKGAPLLNMQDAVNRAARTTTKNGLVIHAETNIKDYDINRQISKSHEHELKLQVVFRRQLPKWNYLIKPTNMGQLIF